MISRKYLKDYRIDEQIEANGRVRSRAVYIGGDYVISPTVTAGRKRLIVWLCALSGLSYIGALIPVTQASRLIYVMLPFAFSALPVFLMTGAALSLVRTLEPMTHSKARRISNRLPPCSLMASILSGSAILGIIVSAAISMDSFVPGDIVFTVLSLILFASSAIIFIKCCRLKALAVNEQGKHLPRDGDQEYPGSDPPAAH